jgi:F-type H+-transporting ATPase subunit b
MQIISNVALISINETLLVQLVSFLLFLYIINRVMFRPLNNVMAKRRDYIEQLKGDTQHALEDYDELTGQIRSQEDAVRKAAQKAAAEKEEAGGREAQQILNEARAEIRTLRKEAEAEVANQVDAARQELGAEADNLAVAIMEKVLGRRLSS